MKAHWYELAGNADAVLEFGDMEDPVPGSGEVRVKIAYSGVNPYDTKKEPMGWMWESTHASFQTVTAAASLIRSARVSRKTA